MGYVDERTVFGRIPEAYPGSWQGTKAANVLLAHALRLLGNPEVRPLWASKRGTVKSRPPPAPLLLSLKNGGENRTFVVAGKQTIKLVGVKPWNPKVAVPLDSPVHTLRFTHVRIKRGATWKLAVVHNAVPAERK